ncbi:MAG: PPC domain-containing protein [Armatimonadetes bacterium]|nr:PPC domain-containing protein [Armatimonadota bacterium]
MTRRLALLCLLPAVLAPAALAQRFGRDPHLGYAFPAGGRQGTTVRVTLGGEDLGGPRLVEASGIGLTTKVVEHVRPLGKQVLGDIGKVIGALIRAKVTGRAFEQPMEDGKPIKLPDHPWLRDLDKKTVDELSTLARKLFDPKRQENAQIAESLIVDVIVDPKAALGYHQLRVQTNQGLSNPVNFEVGVLPEIVEEDQPTGSPARLRRVNEAPPPPLKTYDLPVMINGQIMPGDSDRYRLRAKKGQQLVMIAQARRITPYLADAVPGWFQATLALYDSDGREIAFDDDYRYDPDPVLMFKVPADGLYDLEVRDAIWRGREDFVYRVAVGELPFVTGIWPLGGRTSSKASVSLTGWNIPPSSFALDTQPGAEILRSVFIPGRWLPNPIAYAVDSLPEASEVEPNNSLDRPQLLSLPVTVNGRIGQPGDVDVFAFSGRAGQSVAIEVMARRLQSSLDSLLRLVDSAGKVIALNDDYDDPAAGLITNQADSYLLARLPADGVYRIMLSDTLQSGGPDFGYRLRVGDPRPDFALRTSSSAITVPPGFSAPITVHAARRDGFTGPIDIVLRDAPAGFTLSGNRIPAGRDSVRLTVNAGPKAVDVPFNLIMVGRATVGREVITRPVTPADDLMQAFFFKHLVPARELVVASARGARFVPSVTIAQRVPVPIPTTGLASIILSTGLRPVPPMIKFDLSDPPKGISLQEAKTGAGSVVLVLKIDPATIKPGDADNLIVAVAAEVETGPEGKKKTQRYTLGHLPAIPYVVAAK